MIQLQVIKQLELRAQKVIDEEQRKLLEALHEAQPIPTSTSSHFLTMYDNDINSAAATTTAQITENSNRTPVSIIESEMERYKMFENPGLNCDLLHWWGEHEKTLPLLSKLARTILAIPASSAAAESNFSTAGYVLSPQRSQLNTSLVRSILVCRSNKDFL